MITSNNESIRLARWKLVQWTSIRVVAPLSILSSTRTDAVYRHQWFTNSVIRGWPPGVREHAEQAERY